MMELAKSLPTKIHLEKEASMQPETSLSKLPRKRRKEMNHAKTIPSFHKAKIQNCNAIETALAGIALRCLLSLFYENEKIGPGPR